MGRVYIKSYLVNIMGSHRVYIKIIPCEHYGEGLRKIIPRKHYGIP